MTNDTIKSIEEKIGYEFKEKGLLEQAFTRSSYAEEHYGSRSNEVLEFFGDRSLDFVVTKRISKCFGEMKKSGETITDENGKLSIARIFMVYDAGEYDEGRMTKIKANLVCSESLSGEIDRLGLAEFLLLGKGDEKNEVANEAHVKEDLFEAIIGAVSLDSDWNVDAIERVVDIMLRPAERIEEGLNDEDYIGMLQSWYQKNHEGKTPEYIVKESEDGYSAEVNIFPGLPEDYIKLTDTVAVFFGTGRSKKRACSEAARKAIQDLRDTYDSHKTFKDLVGEPDKERAVNQLQELWQKGYINKPTYEYKKRVDENGQDIWHCDCKILEYDYYGCDGSSKLASKKEAAYVTALQLSSSFNKYSNKETEK